MTYSIDLASISKKFGNEGNIIGFANKFYTLWSYKITENIETHELAFDAYFIKNIGLVNHLTDIYPFDEGLKGKEIHIVSGREGNGLNLTPQEFKALKFSRGTDSGLVISEYCNLSNLCWKYNTCFIKTSLSEARKDAELTNIANRAIELGAIYHEDHLYTPEQVDTTIFSRNPSVNTRIDQCNDCNVLCWKYNNKERSINSARPQFVNDGELENIKARAIELGAVEYNNRLYSPDKQHEDWFIEMVSFSKNIENNEPIIITPTRNISVEGWLWINNHNFYFEHQYYYGTYYGPEHSFPIDSKGKAKQIKNHKIEITSYEKTGDNEYKVISWKFVK
jgi:hypothetical protein